MNGQLKLTMVQLVAAVFVAALCGAVSATLADQVPLAYAATGYSAAQVGSLTAQSYDDDEGEYGANLYNEYGYLYGYAFQNIDGQKRFQCGPNNEYLTSKWIAERGTTAYWFSQTFPEDYDTTYEGCKFYYVGSDGVVTTGLQTIDGTIRYFDADGVMQTGWQKVNGKDYQFNDDGSLHTGFITKGKKTYYMMQNGKLATGEKKIDKAYYYFNKKGVMQTGFVKIKEKRFFYDYKTGHKAGCGVEKGYLINFAKKGQCIKLKNYKTGNQDADAKRVAKQIAKCCKGKKISKLTTVRLAAYYVAVMSSKCTYTMSGSDYYRAYGVFIAKKYSCAGSTRALGMVLDYLKVPWTHVNENQNSHQWCKVKIGKKAGYADGMAGIAGYGKHPAV